MPENIIQDLMCNMKLLKKLLSKYTKKKKKEKLKLKYDENYKWTLVSSSESSKPADARGVIL